LGRAGQPAELAPVYVLLASDEGSYISGARVAVTGGRPILEVGVPPASGRQLRYCSSVTCSHLSSKARALKASVPASVSASQVRWRPSRREIAAGPPPGRRRSALA